MNIWAQIAVIVGTCFIGGVIFWAVDVYQRYKIMAAAIAEQQRRTTEHE